MASSALMVASLALGSPALAQEVSLNGVDDTRNTLAGVTSVENGAATDATLDVNLAADEVFAGVMTDGAGAGRLGLTKTGGAVLTLTGISDYTGSTVIESGGLTLDGGSLLTDAYFAVGQTGAATFDVINDASVLAGNIYIFAGDTMTVENSTVEARNVRVGFPDAPDDAGQSRLVVDGTPSGGGWTLDADLLTLGHLGESDAVLTIQNGARARVASRFVLGESNNIGMTSILSITNGLLQTEGKASVGDNLRSVAVATVTGADSRWSADSITVGEDGDGTLIVSNGAVAEGGVLNVGLDADGVGQLVIGGQGGAAAAGNVDFDTVAFGAGEGSLIFNHTGDEADDYIFAADVSGRGTLSANAGYTTLTGTTAFGQLFLNGGALRVADGGSLSLADTSYVSAGGSPILLLDGAPATGDWTLDAVGTLNFNGGEGSLILQNGSTARIGALNLLGGDLISVTDGLLSVLGNVTLEGAFGVAARMVVSGADSQASANQIVLAGGTRLGALTIADQGLVTTSQILMRGGGAILNVGAAEGEAAVAPGRLDAQNILFSDPGSQIVFNHTGDVTVDGNISGNGGIVKLLAGRTTLSGANTYTGETIFDGGTLALGSDTALGDSTLVVTGAFQEGDPTITAVGGPRVLNNDIVFDRPGALFYAAYLTVDVSDHALTLNGDVTGPGLLSISGTGGLTLMGALDSATSVRLGGLLRVESNFSGNSIQVSGGTLELGDGVDASADIIGTNLTLRTGAGESATLDGSFTLLNNLTFADGDLTLNADLQYPVFNSTLTVTGGSLSLGGSNNFRRLNVSGGAVTLAGANALSGGNILSLTNDGSVVANHALDLIELNMSAASSLSLAATATVTSGGAHTIAGDISGAGGLAFGGGGVFILSGDNSYTGETILSGGTLTLASDTALGGSILRMTGSVLDYADGVTNDQEVIIDSDSSQFRVLTGSATQSGVISEANGLRPFEKIGDGELVLTADNTWTGATRVSGGTLTFDGGSLNLDGNLFVSANGAGLARVVARNGAQVNAGNFLSISGITTSEMLIEGGADVSADAGVYIGDGAGTSGSLTVSGAGSSLNDANVAVGVNGQGQLLIADSAQVTSDGGIIGWNAGSSGSVTVTGAANWNAQNSLYVGIGGNGDLTISQGGTVFSSRGEIGGSSPVVGTVVVEGLGSQWTMTDAGSVLDIGVVGSGSLTIANGGRVAVGSVVIAKNGTSDGVLNIGSAAGDAPVGAGVLDADAVIFGAGDGSLVFNHTSSYLDFDADISGDGRVSVLSGSTRLLGENTYTGTTTVTGGTLNVDGSLTNEGGLTVRDGGRLRGQGDIGGVTTIEDGGIVRGLAGAPLGFDHLILTEGATVEAVLGLLNYTASFDVAGNLTLDGTLNVVNVGAFEPGVHRLFDYDGTLTDRGLEIGATGGAPASALAIQTANPGQVNLIYGGDLQFWDGAGTANDGVIQGGNGTWTATSQNWTDADGNLNGAMNPKPGFAVFQATGGTVTASSADGALSVTGMQFMSDGYTLTGDAIALISPNASAFEPTVLRVGDGRAGGVNMTAEIQNNLSASLGVVKTDLGDLILSGTSVFDGALAVEGGGLTVRGGDVTTLGSLIVEGGGTVSVQNGGRLHSASMIEANGPSIAALLVSGGGSLLTGDNDLTLGLDSTGVMVVDDDGRVETAGGYLGFLDGAYGQATLQNGGVWVAEELFVGYTGEGHVQAFDRAALQIATGDAGGNGSLELGSLSGGYGVLEVEGGFASIENALWVGRAGDGIVDLGADGVIQSGSAVIAEGFNSVSQATINGGHWSNTGAFVVAQLGLGTLYAEAGGSLITGDAVVGEELGGIGMVVISDDTTSWSINGDLTVGAEGDGELQVRDSAVVSGGVGRVGVQAGGIGEITVTGGGAVNLDSLTVGGEGEGRLTLADGGTLTLSGGAGVLTLGDSIASGGGVLLIGGCCVNAPEGAGVLNASEVVFGAGVGELYFNHTETDYTFSAELTGAGMVAAVAGTTRLTGDSADFAGEVFVAGANARLLVDGLLGGDPLTSLTEVSGGGRLGGSGTLDHYVSVGAGGVLEGRSGQTLTLGNLILDPDAAVVASLGAPDAGVLFDVRGDLTLDGELEIVDEGGFGAGLYGLFGYGGTLTDYGLDITAAPDGVSLSNIGLQITSDRVNLINAAGQPVNFWDGGDPALHNNAEVDGGDGIWTAVSDNWTDRQGIVNSPIDPAPGFAIFSRSAGTVTADDVDGALAVTGMQFAVDGYSIIGDAIALAPASGDPAIIRVGDGTGAGAGMTARISATLTGASLVKSDLGTLVLSGSNSYMGGTELRAGTLSVSSDANLGAASGDLRFTGGTLATTASFSSDRSVAFSSAGRFDVATGTTLDMSGTISGSGDLIKRGAGTLALTGSNAYGDTRVEDGTLIGTATALSGDMFNAGTVIFDQAGNASFAGNITGLGGTNGAMRKVGTGALTIEGVSILDWTVDAGTLISSTQQFQGGVAIASGAQFAFNQTEAGVYAKVISGDGDLRFTGGSSVRLTGESSAFGGTTEVYDTTLIIEEALGGSATFGMGGVLSGSGTIGSGIGSTITLASGSVLSPGNSPGTLSVNGDLIFNPGARYNVEVAPGGTARDLVAATGIVTINGGSVAHVGMTGAYDPSSTYTILTAAGGISGQFDPDSVTSDFEFLDASLDYTTDSIILHLHRNDVGFADVGRTFNQRATAGGLASLSSGDELHDAVVQLDAETARSAYDQFSGEIFASVATGLIEDSRHIREAANDRLRAVFDGVGASNAPALVDGPDGPDLAPGVSDTGMAAWGSTFGSWNQTASDGNAAEMDHASGGLIVGADGVLGNWQLGLVAGYSRSGLSIDDRGSSASSDNYHLGVYAGTTWDNLAFRTGLAHTWSDIETDRAVAFTGFSDTVSANYGARTVQAFGELGYTIKTELATFEPFVSLAHVNFNTDGFLETGGAAALTVSDQSTSATFTTIGVRSEADIALGNTSGTFTGMIGWRHAFGESSPLSTHAFSGGDQFTIAGAPIAPNSAVIEAGLDLNLTETATFGVSYQGQIASDSQNHGFTAKLGVKF